jgi:hypothetical protein
MSFQVREADYRAFGYEPAYEQLPWKEDYLATKLDEFCGSLIPLADKFTSRKLRERSLI